MRTGIYSAFRAIVALAVIAGTSQVSSAQTFFETAKGDGILSFQNAAVKKNVLSQLKLDLSNSAVGYGYYYNKGKSTSTVRFIMNVEVKAKPDDNSLATFVKNGQLQPGFSISSALGMRILPSGNVFQVIDLYVKPEFDFNNYTIYDSTRMASAQDPVYKVNKSTVGGNFLLNYLISPCKVNIFFGAQLGVLAGDNLDDLAKGTVQTLTTYPGSATKFLATDVQEVKKGQLKDQTTMPLKLDLVFDPGLQIQKAADGTTMRLGFFGYYRSDVHIAAPTDRLGLGLCFLDAKDPSKIFTSIGYELAAWGSGVSAEMQKTNKGIVFATIGYSIK